MDIKFKDNESLIFQPLIEVEYLKSNGNQYINTGLKAQTDRNFVIEFTVHAASGGIFGSSGAAAYHTGFNLYYSNNAWRIYGTSGNMVSISSLTYNTKRYHLEYKPGRVILYDVDDPETLIVNSTLSNSYTTNGIYLFAIHGSTGEIGKSSTTIYYCKVYDGETLTRDFVPAICNGIPCMYDKVTKTCYYNSGSGSFTYGPFNTNQNNILKNITSLYVENCPNIDNIILFKDIKHVQDALQQKVSRIRLDASSTPMTINELYDYSILSGFNDNYEEQIKPRLVGTIDMTSSYYSNEELNYLQSSIDGITINVDTNKNVDTLLENDGFKVQTLDSTKPNYNPAVCVIMHNSGYFNASWKTHYPIVEGGGLYYYPKAASSKPGVNIFRGKTTVVDTNGVVSDDTTAEYDFDSFEEFQYFDNTSVTAGSSTSALGAFGGCTKLKKIILPNTVTSIGAYAFYDCTALEDITIPSGVTSIGNNAFYNCISIKNLIIPCNVTNGVFRGTTSSVATYTVGNYSGDLIIKGNLGNSNYYSTRLYFNHIYIYGTSKSDTGGGLVGNGIIRFNGDSVTYNSGGFIRSDRPFVECMNNVSGYNTSCKYFSNNTFPVVHFGRTSVVTATPTVIRISAITKLYVGDGTSRAADEAVFALYNADTNWATYCGNGVPGAGKVDLWYDYNGEYKWYYVTDSLTNCTNTNPDAWPHITRGESYETTIVADEGMTIDSITVEMLDTDTTSPTYDTYVPQPTSYDSATGIYTISIPSVTGNVIITANAN